MAKMMNLRRGIYPAKPRPSVAGAHKYWRLAYTATNDIQANKVVSVSEIQFRQVAGVAVNMLSLGAATAVNNFGAAYVPSKALDNDVNTAYITAQNAWHLSLWTMIFTTPQPVVEMMFQAYPNALGAGQMWRDLNLLSSDDNVTYTLRQTITGQTAWGVAEVRTFAVP